MSRRVTERIKMREAALKVASPVVINKPTYPEEVIVESANIDAHSSGAKFDVPKKPRTKKTK